MIDLHVHLAGSLKPATIIEYAKERNVPLPTYNASELESYLEAPDHCPDIAEFYELCDMTDWVLQERRAIRRAMTEMVKELDAQGVMYAEIRFSPSECCLLYTSRCLPVGCGPGPGECRIKWCGFLCGFCLCRCF